MTPTGEGAAAHYRRRIAEAYLGEFQGIALFTELGNRLGGDADKRAKLALLVHLERRTAEELSPLVARYGLGPFDTAAQERIGLDWALKAETWNGMIEMLLTDIPPYVAAYDGLRDAAAAGDRPMLEFLAAHERALLRFAQLEAQGRGAESLGQVRRLLRYVIRESAESDFRVLVSLNAESEHFLSPLSLPRLQFLHPQAWYRRVICLEETVLGFMLAFRPGADYDSPNYRWFAARYADFLYIDRIVIGGSARGQGLAARLYEDLFTCARGAGITRITCEFDVDPPNEVSRRFHERFGFREVGSQRVAGGKKAVSLQQLLL
ncbi:MAG: GNAT family N-acetyltransferase [Steroidobacteraceae bacterium]